MPQYLGRRRIAREREGAAIMSFKPEWIQAAGAEPLAAAQMIVSGLKDLKELQPEWDVLEAFGLDVGSPLRIIDFGAGMLRNTVALLEMSPLWRVTAFDLYGMIIAGWLHFRERLEPHQERLAKHVCFGGRSVHRFDYDTVLACLVFQHMEPDHLRAVLRAIAKSGAKLCVYGRRTFDDLQTPVWPVVLEFFSPVKLFPKIGQCSVLGLQSGDPHDHIGGVFVPWLEKTEAAA